MTKKERAAIDATIKELRIRAALCWSDKVAPDVPIPESSSVLTKGWLPAHWCYAELACSNAVHHGTGRDDRTTSQGPRELYSTRLLALRARRYEVALHSACALALIDQAIEDELAEASAAPSK